MVRTVGVADYWQIMASDIDIQQAVTTPKTDLRKTYYPMSTKPKLMKNKISPFRVQWRPNVVAYEKRICLTRIRWENGIVGDGKGYSAKLSVSLCFVPEDFWIGIFWKRRTEKELSHRGSLYLCLVPMFPIRIKLIKSWGGIIP
jgi:hypothetical protein